MGALTRFAKAIGIGNFPTPSGLPSGHENRPSPRSDYMRAERGQVFKGWWGSQRSNQDDIAAAIQLAAARTTELWQNNGWISGMVDQAAANTVGTGLRLRSMPENDLFGMTEAEAQDWRKLVEARWDGWSNNANECDIEGRQTIPQMTASAFKHWIITGEIFAELVWRKRPNSKTGTKVRLLSSTRIINKTDAASRIFAGVRQDADGRAVSYFTRRKNPLLGDEEIETQARDRYGRPKVILVFEGPPGVTRGIGILVPVLKVAKQFDQLSDATLLASIVQTVFAVSIESEAPTQDALQGLLNPREQALLMKEGLSTFDAFSAARDGWGEGHPIDVGFAGRIAHMFPGEKLSFHSPSQPATAYREFSLHLLREMARCLGLTYESATGDYEKATYASVRAAVNEIFTLTKMRRKYLLSPFLQAIYEAWLEEEIQTGRIPFPGGIDGFIENRAAACRARWHGEPKPIPDDLKQAKAHETYRNMGVLADDHISTDLGYDIEDVYAQRAREAEMRADYNLPDNCYPQSLSQTEAIENAPEPSEDDPGNGPPPS